LTKAKKYDDNQSARQKSGETKFVEVSEMKKLLLMTFVALCLFLAVPAIAQPSALSATPTEEVNWHALVAFPFLRGNIYPLSGGYYWPYPGPYGHPDTYTISYRYYIPGGIPQGYAGYYLDGGWWGDPRGYRPIRYIGPGYILR